MGAGKILILIGGLLTLVSCFFLSFFNAGGGLYGSGLGFIYNIANIMADPGSFVPGETMTVYIVAIVYIVFLISGILQLVGLASRVVAIIGSIIVLAISVTVLLVLFNILGIYAPYLTLFNQEAIVPGVLPLDVSLGSASLGAYTLLAGGVLGFVGGILGTKD